MEHRKDPVRQALWRAGGPKAVAERLGIARSTLYNWLAAREVPPKRLDAFLRETGLSAREWSDVA